MITREEHGEIEKQQAGDNCRYLVVSIHDVAPCTRSIVEKMLLDLEALGVRQTSLLVVPDYHQTGRIGSDDDFVHFMAEALGGGHEAVLHGFHHQRKAREGETIRDKMVTRFYTAGEGEFYDISQFEAEKLLKAGRAAFREAGLLTEGFIAPAWLLGASAAKACQATDFAYTVLFDAVWDFKRNVRHHARSLVYSTRAAWRRLVSRWFNPFLFAKTKHDKILRISLHPPDYVHPRVWSQVLRLSRQALSSRHLVTYGGLVSRLGNSPPPLVEV